jgi:hypothetical protein
MAVAASKKIKPRIIDKPSCRRRYYCRNVKRVRCGENRQIRDKRDRLLRRSPIFWLREAAYLVEKTISELPSKLLMSATDRTNGKIGAGMGTRTRNGNVNISAAIAVLLQTQAQFVAELAETRKEFAAIRQELETIKAVLLRHENKLEKLADAIREKIGFKN